MIRLPHFFLLFPLHFQLLHQLFVSLPCFKTIGIVSVFLVSSSGPGMQQVLSKGMWTVLDEFDYKLGPNGYLSWQSLTVRLFTQKPQCGLGVYPLHFISPFADSCGSAHHTALIIASLLFCLLIQTVSNFRAGPRCWILLYPNLSTWQVPNN